MSDSATEEREQDSVPAPIRPRGWKRFWWWWGLRGAVLYVIWCAMIYLIQDSLVFPANQAAPPRAELPPVGAVVMKRNLADGEQVQAWFIPAPTATPETPAPVVIFCHGNAEIIDHQGAIVAGYRRMGCSVLLLEYRGYGRAGGEPSERAIVADSVGFYDELIKRDDVDAARIVMHGRSLGGAVAAQLAERRTPAALIVQSTFTSVASFASGYGVPGFIAKHPFRTDHVLADLDVPVLIFHGSNDDIIPVAHSRTLRDLAKHATYREFDCDHNSFPGTGNTPAYWQQIKDFLKTCDILENQNTH